jgi:hypothetical protein
MPVVISESGEWKSNWPERWIEADFVVWDSVRIADRIHRFIVSVSGHCIYWA